MVLCAKTFFSEGPRKVRSRAGAFAAALVVSALAFSAIHDTTPVRAGENASDEDTGSRFVRIGLNKSIVIRLPAAARDVLVGNPDIVEAVVRTKNTAYLFARAVGQTNIFFFDEQGQQILALDLEVAQDMAALQKLIRRTLPGTQITVDTVGENIVLGGSAANAAEHKTAMDLAAKFTNDPNKVMSTVAIAGSQQVMLRVRVVEIQRKVLKQLGVNTQAVFSVGNISANLANINPFQNPLISSAAGNAISYQSGDTKVDAVLRAMESDGLVRTLAEPTLIATSGEEAKFTAGGEFPVPVPDDDGKIKIEYKPFGVILNFTPTVLSQGRIGLKVHSEVSEISSISTISISGNTAPIINTRNIDTSIELPSGGSMAMAGLIKDVNDQTIKGIPGLKSVPVLGALFRSRDYISDQTELAVIVTPYTVNPVNESQLATPVDGLNIATDAQTILLGRLNKVYGSPGAAPNGVYHGNVGYIVK
jgi:pilus assembly protein CpaC